MSQKMFVVLDFGSGGSNGAPSDMEREPWNEFHTMWFDPGVKTGWAWLVVNVRAFSRPEHDWLPNIALWDCGELSGTETEVLKKAVALVDEMRDAAGFLMHEVGGEDFDLTQLIGSKENLLSPVRINAVIAWECAKRSIAYRLQRRNERTNVTRDRLARWQFDGGFRKDEFAAMQHAVTRVRKIKKEADRVPWKLNTPDIINGDGWDCACNRPSRTGRVRRCNLIHP